MTTWTYQELKDTCAFYGFTFCPLSEKQADELIRDSYSLDGAYGVACDIACGHSFEESKTLTDNLEF